LERNAIEDLLPYLLNIPREKLCQKELVTVAFSIDMDGLIREEKIKLEKKLWTSQHQARRSPFQSDTKRKPNELSTNLMKRPLVNANKSQVFRRFVSNLFSVSKSVDRIHNTGRDSKRELLLATNHTDSNVSVSASVSSETEQTETLPTSFSTRAVHLISKESPTSHSDPYLISPDSLRKRKFGDVLKDQQQQQQQQRIQKSSPKTRNSSENKRRKSFGLKSVDRFMLQEKENLENAFNYQYITTVSANGDDLMDFQSTVEEMKSLRLQSFKEFTTPTPCKRSKYNEENFRHSRKIPSASREQFRSTLENRSPTKRIAPVEMKAFLH